MNPIQETMKGITDIPLALLALLFGAMLWRRQSRDWAKLMILIGAAGVLGALVHMFTLAERSRQIIWIVLFLLMYEVVRRFAKLMVEYSTENDRREPAVVWVAAAALYGVSIAALFFSQKLAMTVFIVFAAIMFSRIAVNLARCGFTPKKASELMLVVLVPIALQAFSGIIPGAVVMEHLILMAALLLVYRIGAESGDECPAFL